MDMEHAGNYPGPYKDLQLTELWVCVGGKMKKCTSAHVHTTI